IRCKANHPCLKAETIIFSGPNLEKACSLPRARPVSCEDVMPFSPHRLDRADEFQRESHPPGETNAKKKHPLALQGHLEGRMTLLVGLMYRLLGDLVKKSRTRGPFIVNAGGNAWDPLPPNAPQPGTSTQAGGGGQTSTTTANVNAQNTRRRESTPTNSGSTSRLARGFDRLRSLGSSTSAAPNPAGPSGSSSTSNIPTSSTNTMAQQPEASSSRSRPWERFFSRDGTAVSTSTTTMPTGSINEGRRSVDNGSATSSTSNETARVVSGRPSLSTSDGLRAGTNRNPAADDARQYTSLRSRPRENPILSSFSHETSDIPNPSSSLTPISTSQNELSGLVRNNLVLANQSQPSVPGAAFSQAATSRLGISTSALNNNGGLFGNGRSSSMVEVPRPGIGARSATGTNMTMLDSNPTDSAWGANSSPDITMD
ncbi:17300_t:CDS:2, partial [Acaulospora colombiana]